MTTATPADHALARWLLATELGDLKGSCASATAAERVFQKLGLRLAQLVTPVGYKALLARARHLSVTQMLFLNGARPTRVASTLNLPVHGGTDPDISNHAVDDHEVVLATLIALLESFIGNVLTLRVLRDVWLTLPTPQPTQPHRPGDLEADH